MTRSKLPSPMPLLLSTVIAVKYKNTANILIQQQCDIRYFDTVLTVK